MDAWTLFVTLDVDGDHTVGVDEFVERCLQLHGPAKSTDLFALRQQTEKLIKQGQGLVEGQRQIDRHVAYLSIKVPGVFLRPMMSQVREALFSMLGACDVFDKGSRVLDLFAGSGIVGLESASRGAGHVTFVDASPVCARAIEQNCKALGVEGIVNIACTKAEQFLASPAKFGAEKPFDLVTATPPYEEVSYGALLTALAESPALGEDTLLVVEYPNEHEEPWGPDFQKQT
eukprot:g3594.t1